MISIMDRGIGKIITALKQKGILENTVILFIADNGSPSIGEHANAGSNYPFKGVNNISLQKFEKKVN